MRSCLATRGTQHGNGPEPGEATRLLSRIELGKARLLDAAAAVIH